MAAGVGYRPMCRTFLVNHTRRSTSKALYLYIHMYTYEHMNICMYIYVCICICIRINMLYFCSSSLTPPPTFPLNSDLPTVVPLSRTAERIYIIYIPVLYKSVLEWAPRYHTVQQCVWYIYAGIYTLLNSVYTVYIHWYIYSVQCNTGIYMVVLWAVLNSVILYIYMYIERYIYI